MTSLWVSGGTQMEVFAPTRLQLTKGRKVKQSEKKTSEAEHWHASVVDVTCPGERAEEIINGPLDKLKVRSKRTEQVSLNVLISLIISNMLLDIIDIFLFTFSTYTLPLNWKEIPVNWTQFENDFTRVAINWIFLDSALLWFFIHPLFSYSCCQVHFSVSHR